MAASGSDLELFSNAEDEDLMHLSRSSSPTIPLQNHFIEDQHQQPSLSSQTTSYHNGSIPRNCHEHVTTGGSSAGKRKPTQPKKTDQHRSTRTPQGRRGRALSPSQLIRFQHDADDSSSDESVNETRDEPSRKRQKQPSHREKSVQMESLEDMKAMLMLLCEKVDKNNRALKEIQAQQCSSSVSSSSGGSYKPKRSISLTVRKEVRKCYKALLDDDDDFQGWSTELGVSIKSDENQSVVRRLVKEVRGLNPTFDAADIREAAYRFYKTKCEEDSLKRKGTDVAKKRSRRRHERIARKRKEREAAILKNSRLTEDQKKKWLAVMTNNFMSSEESGTEDSIVVHPLPWRTEYVNKMFRKIDAYCESKKSPQAKRQTKRREYGMASSRPEPDINEDLPRWAVNISTDHENS